MERGVIIGGLMICGSFLLAALLNRSAMEELPTPATPTAIVAPMSAPALEAEVASTATDCAETEPPAETTSVTKTEQAALERCGGPE